MVVGEHDLCPGRRVANLSGVDLVAETGISSAGHSQIERQGTVGWEGPDPERLSPVARAATAALGLHHRPLGGWW